MPCQKQCNQGRDCDCSRSRDRATVVVVTLLFVAFISIVSMGWGVYSLFHGTKGQDCAVEVRFKDSVATYLGKSV
jgi:hypothetical protein